MNEYLHDLREDPSYEQYWKKEIARDMKESSLSLSEGGNPVIRVQIPMNYPMENK